MLSTAFKFTEHGSVTLEITETARAGGVTGVHFSVTDTGICIQDDRREFLFKDFSLAESSTTREYGGTGLGMAISQRLCNLLAGEIELTSPVV